ncbi:MAG: hypothetical protein ACR2F6_08080 [Mycobacteriales bacterium]
MGETAELGDGRFAEVRRYVSRLAAAARERAAATARTAEPRGHQELAETAMALMTLWTTFEEPESDQVAATTRSLLAGLSAEELAYLVLHLAGLTRGLTRVLGSQSDDLDLDAALQMVARELQRRPTA